MKRLTSACLDFVLSLIALLAVFGLFKLGHLFAIGFVQVVGWSIGAALSTLFTKKTREKIELNFYNFTVEFITWFISNALYVVAWYGAMFLITHNHTSFFVVVPMFVGLMVIGLVRTFKWNRASIKFEQL